MTTPKTALCPVCHATVELDDSGRLVTHFYKGYLPDRRGMIDLACPGSGTTPMREETFDPFKDPIEHAAEWFKKNEAELIALRQTVASLRAQLAAARKDTERLDWLGLNFDKISVGATCFLRKLPQPYCWEDQPTLRAAIDAAGATNKQD